MMMMMMMMMMITIKTMIFIREREERERERERERESPTNLGVAVAQTDDKANDRICSHAARVGQSPFEPHGRVSKVLRKEEAVFADSKFKVGSRRSKHSKEL